MHRPYPTPTRTVRLAVVLALGFPLLLSVGKTAGPPQSGQAAPQPSADAQRCAALANADFEGLPDAPTRIMQARLVDVPPADPQAPPGGLAASPIKQYCQVMGYVAPQNKFELRLPLPCAVEPAISSHALRRVLRRGQRERVQPDAGPRVCVDHRQRRT